MKGKKPTVDEAIRIEAYLLSEKAGHPHGLESYFWEQAHGIVQARTLAVAKAVKTAAKQKSATKPAKKDTANKVEKSKSKPGTRSAGKSAAKPKSGKKKSGK